MMDPLLLIQWASLLVQVARGLVDAINVSDDITPEQLNQIKGEVEAVHNELLMKIAEAKQRLANP